MLVYPVTKEDVIQETLKDIECNVHKDSLSFANLYLINAKLWSLIRLLNSYLQEAPPFSDLHRLYSCENLCIQSDNIFWYRVYILQWKLKNCCRILSNIQLRYQSHILENEAPMVDTTTDIASKMELALLQRLVRPQGFYAVL